MNIDIELQKMHLMIKIDALMFDALVAFEANNHQLSWYLLMLQCEALDELDQFNKSLC